jgi:hypothetical protein
VARTAGAEPLHDETNVLTIARTDLDAADTLRLRAMGDLFPCPTRSCTARRSIST